MDFNLKGWLAEFKLDEYHALFTENELEEPEDIIEFSEEDFKEIGVTKKVHLVRLRKAQQALLGPSKKADVPELSGESEESPNYLKQLPNILALPLAEYRHESNSCMRLWHACDSMELLIRFLVIISLAERQAEGQLTDKLIKRIKGLIERPTLGAWLSMAIIPLCHHTCRL